MTAEELLNSDTESQRDVVRELDGRTQRLEDELRLYKQQRLADIEAVNRMVVRETQTAENYALATKEIVALRSELQRYREREPLVHKLVAAVDAGNARPDGKLSFRFPEVSSYAIDVRNFKVAK